MAVLLALVAGAAPTPGAGSESAPSVAIVNPIDTGSTVFVSDAETVNSDWYTLLAWSTRASGDAVGEFVFENGVYTHTVAAYRNPSTVWFHLWSPPEGMPDGPYTLSFRLLQNGAVVAEDRMDVVVTGRDGPQPAPALWLHRPSVGRYGFYDPPGLRPGTRMSFEASEDTPQVRAVYSTAARGTEPEWKSCGRAPTDAHPEGFRYAEVRCALAPGDRAGDVTALGGIANGTDSDEPPDPQRDGSSTATITKTYSARPVWLRTYASAISGYQGECTGITVYVEDQLFQPVWSAPVDLHLAIDDAPSTFGDTTAADAVQAPDAGHGSPEQAMACQGEARSSQARHGDNRGAAVHAELRQGTDHLGGAQVVVFEITRRRPGRLHAWIDQDDDDRYDRGETSDFLVWPYDETLTLRAAPARPRAGARVDFTGSLDGAHDGCIYGVVRLETRRSSTGAWRLAATDYTNDYGEFWIERRVHRPAFYRAVLPAADPCPRAVSPVIRVRTR